MFLIYDDTSPRFTGRRFDFANANANRFYLEHYQNYLTLSFIANNNLATFSEKARARTELQICERKMEYWKRHANFRWDVVREEIVKLRRAWEERG